MALMAKIKDGIKSLGFRFTALFFNAAAHLPVKKNRIILFSLHNAHFKDALGEVELELKKRPEDFEIIRVDRNDLFRSKASALKFMIVDAFRMGRAKCIFMNNNYMAMAYMNPNPDTVVVQVWHGQGAFKKFGFDIPQPPEVRAREIGANKNVDYVVCSAPWVKKIYASAFGMREDQVLDIGNPNQDYFFRPENAGEEACKARRAAFDAQYPVCKGKYLVFYAPTFRDDPAAPPVLSHVNFSAMKEAVDAYLKKRPDGPKECCILVRLHPKGAGEASFIKGDFVLDMTDYPDGNALCFLSDLMITDYSSICMNMTLLNKPMVFYAYDLDTYLKDRDFYCSYDDVPGPICQTEEALYETLRSGNFREDKLDFFRNLHYGSPDGKATEKLLNFLFS